ncbi:Trafficking protein particle complex subunit 11 [Daphnia magna]|uniref:Uncharacterized protein n=2 Tax=Daphnia magna TaxID=35525 RepID=A0ABQ9ZQ11_9CRUS|nr:hypothetical protein OUZ56_027530 [Daphnia magna]KZS07470.1 Trafficking protein particle complex subunit 11 [Daphnia magna]
MSSDLELPAELMSRPLALVGLTGLHVETNQTHLLIWNSFTSSNRNERPPLNFILFGVNHTFPVAKPDRASYEWYIPKGILKRKWMSKHLNQIPGVLVLFYDLEWEDPSWKAKHAECAHLIQTIRMKLMGRGTKLCLVLLQNSAPLPSSEDILAADRAAALCQVCELPPKSLFVLPCRSDHLQGYTLRLESAFYELCQSSYHLSSRAIRSHRDQLNRTNHGYLFVRHQFKIGFYHELKQDVAMAHKHYSQSYAHLLELRITDANVTEVKIVSGYIGYKVWRLSFLLNLPREAIAHFRSHMDFFRLRVGNPLSKFEHHAWLAAQFSTFGRLFEDAIELGLPAIQTQHPGFFYQQAAQQAIQRKKACYQDYAALEQTAINNLTPLFFGESSQLEFYGQRPWRPNRLSLEPSDMKTENDGITALLVRERLQVDLTAMIVGALTNAVNQFKNHRSPRMKQYLLVQMAEEYCRSENYMEALTLLEPLLWDYRKDFWWMPLTSLLQLGLRCAYLSGRPAEYFTYAVELCSRVTIKSLEEKTHVFDNLVGILQKRMPPSPPDSCDYSSATQLWADQFASLAKGACITTIVTNTISSFVEVKATFTQKQFAAEDVVELEVHVIYTGPKPIRFTSLHVALNNSAYLPFCQVKNSDELEFEPNQIRHYEFEFVAQAQDIGTELQIVSVTFEMGDELTAYLRCEGSSSEEFSPLRSEFPSATEKGLAGIFVLNTTEILPRTANVELVVHHEAPALRGECYPLHLELFNRENEDIINVTLTVTTSSSNGRVHDQPKIDGNVSAQLKNEKLTAGQTCQWNVFAQMEQPGNHCITFQVNYEINSEMRKNSCTYKSQYVKTLELETVQPVECEAQFQTIQFQPLRQIPVGEECVAVMTVTNLSPFPLQFEQGVWKFDTLLTNHPMGNSQLAGLILQKGEKANDVAVLSLDNGDNRQIRTGSYTLKWKRSNQSKVEGYKIPYSASSFDLPEMETWSVPLRIHVTLPAHGYVRESMNMTIVIHNPGPSYIELDVYMSSNDAFMFAGNKQIKIQIYPEDDYVLKYNLYPLLSGFVALPPLQLKTPTSTMDQVVAMDQSVLDELVSRYVPTHIYVLPQAKEKGKTNLLRSE